ncbi:unnamed protein product [Adineta steineri]|uniref:Lipocalin/cytosolic fatty-acid binding domain-containing protein n=1 Tax=Adineta steineri TaxID=433720 RepID=A0A813UI94_9BILA|nr:unnamed protein product [Adineta steineri]CAF0823769.1 unnamed protein product [Adineta steineri]CAF0864280.1 unnamed protein product [Adineta steineri]
MATVTGRARCVTCNQERSAVRCEGCSQIFCYDHLTDHRQELSVQFDEIERNRDLFRDTLNKQINDSQNHFLIRQIDKWEADSIQIIQQTATEYKQMLFQHTNKYFNQIEINLTKLTDQLKRLRKENDLNEIDLNYLKEKIIELEKELDQPPNVSIQQNSASLINRISVAVSPISNDVEKLKGTWEYVGGESFDDYMKELGVNFVERQSYKLVTPRIVIRENGGKWLFKSESTFTTTQYEFTPGVEFDETRLDGGRVKSIIKFENDKWIHTRRGKNGKETTLVRWVDTQGQQRIVMQAGAVEARRWYKRIH